MKLTHATSPGLRVDRPEGMGHPPPMLSLATCRKALARTAWSRGVGLLLALGLMAAGLPRWDVHVHAAAERGHSHPAVLAEHDEPAPDVGNDAGSAVAHLHDAVSVSATLPTVLPLSVIAFLPDRWSPPISRAPVATAAGPPPHRPPIV